MIYEIGIAILFLVLISWLTLREVRAMWVRVNRLKEAKKKLKEFNINPADIQKALESFTQHMNNDDDDDEEDSDYEEEDKEREEKGKVAYQ